MPEIAFGTFFIVIIIIITLNPGDLYYLG